LLKAGSEPPISL